MLLILFGIHGTGKTYVAKLLKYEFGFYFWDGDNQLTDNMKQALKEKKLFNDSMRNVFFKNLIGKVEELCITEKNLVIAQTFIKEKYRKQFLKIFPDAKFILVKTKNALREKRLLKRNDLDLDYVKNMIKLFEKPTIKYFKIQNDTEGSKEIVKSLQKYS